MQENTEENYSINQRFLQILDYYGFTRYKFSKETGVSEPVLLNISKGKNKIGLDVIEKLLNFNSAINLNWLVSGEGEMFTTPAVEEVKKPAISKSVSEKDAVKLLLEMLASRDNTIQDLNRLVGRLQEQNDVLREDDLSPPGYSIRSGYHVASEPRPVKKNKK